MNLHRRRSEFGVLLLYRPDCETNVENSGTHLLGQFLYGPQNWGSLTLYSSYTTNSVTQLPLNNTSLSFNYVNNREKLSSPLIRNLLNSYTRKLLNSFKQVPVCWVFRCPEYEFEFRRTSGFQFTTG